MRLIDADKLMNDVRKTITEKSGAIDWINLIASMPEADEAAAGWIPVAEQLPDKEKEVLVMARRKHANGIITNIITTAIYEDGTVPEVKSIWTWDDIEYIWDEENDCNLVPKGWWEYRHYNADDVSNNLVDNEVVAWMPLPEPYREER